MIATRSLDRIRKAPAALIEKARIYRGVKDYIGILSTLHREGVLGNAVVYPAIGVDLFPALFATTFGFDIHSIQHFDFFAESIGKFGPNTGGWSSKVSANMNYFGGVDAHEVGRMAQVLGEKGFGSIAGRRSLVLKGAFEYLFEKEFDADVERYYSQRAPLIAAGEWLKSMLELFRTGDRLILFDRDLKISKDISGLPLRELAISSPRRSIFSGPEGASREILLDPGETMGLVLNLPKRFRAYEMI